MAGGILEINAFPVAMLLKYEKPAEKAFEVLTNRPVICYAETLL